jgi:hypothetical protein
MATGTYGADGRSPQRPTHLGAWPLLYLGWADRYRVGADTTVAVHAISEGGPVLELWCNGEASPEHYLIEHRDRSGFDRDLPWPGLIVVQIDEALLGLRLGSNRVNVGPVPALRVLEGDGDQDMMRGLNRGDAYDPVPGSLGVRQLDDESIPALRSLSGATTNLALKNIVPWPGYTTVDVRVTAVGWNPSRAFPPDAGAPQPTLSPSTRFVRGVGGMDHLAGVEQIAGVSRVLLRDLRDGEFGPSIPLDLDPAPGNEPSLAALPGGDLVAAWTRGAAGAGRIVVRTRIAGEWREPVPISPVGQVASAPTVSADASGRVCVAWLGRDGGGDPRVWFARFVYTSPFAQPVVLSTSTQQPGEPLVVNDPHGTAYVIWSERSVFPAGLWHVRSHPDSLPSAPLRLVNTTGYPQLGFGAAVDTARALHTVWHVAGLGVSEIHWQRRPFASAPMPRDSIIDSRGDGLRDPSVSADAHGNVHATWLRQQAWGREVRYNRWRIGRSWDHQSSPVSTASEGSSDRPAVLGRSADEATVVWFAHVETEPAERSRTRTAMGALLGSPIARTPEPRRVLTLAPNPMRAGDPLVVSGAAGFETLEVFDAQGRRVARGTADARGRVRLEPSLSSSWRAGLYLARGFTSAGVTRFVVLR